jgi:dTDP-L-rhamnose 4-epimerase
VHFGAAVSVGQSMYQVDRYVDVNTRGTALLLDILVNAKHNVEKVLVASSIGVYGEGAYQCATHGAVAPTIRPEQQLAAARLGTALSRVLRARGDRSDAGRQGALSRQHLLDDEVPPGRDGASDRQDLRHSVASPRDSSTSTATPEPEQPYAGVAAIWLSRLLNGKQPMVFEDGGQLRDFVSIHDVVDCLVLMLEKPGATTCRQRRIGETVTILDIARLLARLLGSSIEPQITQTGRKFDIRHNTLTSRARARRSVSHPRSRSRQGFSELIEWAKTTPDRRGRLFRQGVAGTAGQRTARQVVIVPFDRAEELSARP